MKKLLVLALGILSLSSCGTTGGGAMTGAMFGGMIGSAIGGIAGGPRGSDVGTLIGMATGAATGAAVTSASEKAERNRYGNQTQSFDGDYYDPSGSGNDIIYMDPADGNMNVPSATLDAQLYGEPVIEIRNAQFTDANGNKHIDKGETVKVSFEIHNVSNKLITNIVPVVQETTGNKRISVSPAILVETLHAKKAVRYTAYISAKKSLKTGVAHFRLSVNSGNTLLSNVVEFDVTLN